ncbi:hypothetical protein GCM10027615_43900 [Plantactinospora veratri]
MTDALRLAGRPVPEHLAATEVAAHARSSLPGAPGPEPGPGPELGSGPEQPGRPGPLRPATPPVDDLAALVNLAAFAPGNATDDQARRAGELAVAYAAELRAGRPWWRRVIWSLHPGPLRWRR